MINNTKEKNQVKSSKFCIVYPLIAVLGAIYCLRSGTLHQNSQKEIQNSNPNLQRILLTSISNTIGSYTIKNSES